MRSVDDFDGHEFTSTVEVRNMFVHITCLPVQVCCRSLRSWTCWQLTG